MTSLGILSFVIMILSTILLNIVLSTTTLKALIISILSIKTPSIMATSTQHNHNKKGFTRVLQFIPACLGVVLPNVVASFRLRMFKCQYTIKNNQGNLSEGKQSVRLTSMLLVINCLDQLLLISQTLFTFLQNKLP
jgi:hypothetical protein